VSGAHIEENLLEQYAMGVLPDRPRTTVDEHLLVCLECQARLVQVDEFLAAFRPAVLQVCTQPLVARKQFRLLPRFVRLGSVAALAACVLFVILRPGAHPVAPAIIQMRAFRGTDRAARLPAGRSAMLVFNVAGQSRLAKYEIEVVDLSGKAIWTVETEAKGDSLRIGIRKLDPGSYWVRIYRGQPDKRLLEEYALRVEQPSIVKR